MRVGGIALTNFYNVNKVYTFIQTKHELIQII